MSVEWSISFRHPKYLVQRIAIDINGDQRLNPNFWPSPFPKLFTTHLVKGYWAVGELRASS
jgi:hypothetical protein